MAFQAVVSGALLVVSFSRDTDQRLRDAQAIGVASRSDLIAMKRARGAAIDHADLERIERG